MLLLRLRTIRMTVWLSCSSVSSSRGVLSSNIRPSLKLWRKRSHPWCPSSSASSFCSHSELVVRDAAAAVATRTRSRRTGTTRIGVLLLPSSYTLLLRATPWWTWERIIGSSLSVLLLLRCGYGSTVWVFWAVCAIVVVLVTVVLVVFCFCFIASSSSSSSSSINYFLNSSWVIFEWTAKTTTSRLDKQRIFWQSFCHLSTWLTTTRPQHL